MQYYDLKIAGLNRKFPIVSLGPKYKVVSFNILGDRKLAEYCAKELCKKIKNVEFDYLLGPETTVLPLIHEMSSILKSDKYVILRKQIHGYMTNPISTSGKYNLVINGPDATLIRNKKVVIVDDIISTGKTIKTILELLSKLNTTVVAKVSILKQGDVFDDETKDLIYLKQIPLIKNS